jgi:hypothetical protein
VNGLRVGLSGVNNCLECPLAARRRFHPPRVSVLAPDSDASRHPLRIAGTKLVYCGPQPHSHCAQPLTLAQPDWHAHYILGSPR